MRTDLTDITILLDRSGSMEVVKQDTIGGFNEFLKKQAEGAGEARLSLFQFDDVFEEVYSGVDIKAAPPLTKDSFVPRGSTALYDAICTAIDKTGKRLAAMKEEDRPGFVIFVIQTDGFENSSHKHPMADVSNRISTQRDTYKWQFIYLGANQDAIAEAGKLGINQGAAMSYKQSAAGVKLGGQALGQNIANARHAYVISHGNVATAAASLNFTEAQREEQEDLLTGKK